MSIERYDNLPNKPLVEAILEIKWGEPTEPDRAYPIIVGRLYERLKGDYPAIRDLALVQVPPDLTVHSARHQFRRTPDGWPVVQIGPGVVTLNDTERYTWADFQRRAERLRPALSDSHPEPDKLRISSLMLQYIDAYEFDFERDDVRHFLKTKMHIDLSMSASFFDQQPVADRAADATVQMTFPSSDPKGQVQFRIFTGRKEDRPAIIWHTLIRSGGPDAEGAWQDFSGWLGRAHAIVDHLFFAMIQGDLLKEFARQ